jgi:hypothetical protein
MGAPVTDLVTGGRLFVLDAVLFDAGVDSAARQGATAPVFAHAIGDAALHTLLQQGVAAAGAPDAAAVGPIIGRAEATGDRAAFGDLGQLGAGAGGAAVIAQVGALGAAFGLGADGGMNTAAVGSRLPALDAVVVITGAAGDGAALGDVGQLGAGADGAAVIGQIGANALRSDGARRGASGGVALGVAALGTDVNNGVTFQADLRGALDDTAVLTRGPGDAYAQTTVLIASVGLDTLVQVPGAGGDALGAELVLHLRQGQGI